jgi:hypothetical protein
LKFGIAAEIVFERNGDATPYPVLEVEEYQVR